MFRIPNNNSMPSKLAISTFLEIEENSAKRAIKIDADRGELPYYELVPSKVYKMVFSLLTVNEMKEARLVCKKWHGTIFPMLEEKSCFRFSGEDNPSELTKARLLSAFLNVVPKDSFQWKMLKALYPKPEEALPIPVLIHWSHLRINGANYLELRQWISRGHTANVCFLQLTNIRMNWAKYLLIFRELENLSKLHDTSISVDSGIWEEFEKYCAFNEKLISTPTFQAHFNPRSISTDLIFHCRKIKEIKIRRARIEELITFLKLFLIMECVALEVLELSAEDCLRSCLKTKKKNVRLQEPKNVFFAHLGALLNRNRENLESVKVSFRPSTISGWFDQYTREKYEDSDGVLYKPDLRDFLLFIKHHRWHEAIKMRKLNDLKLEFENRKIPTVEEIEYLTIFLCSLSESLRTLSISHFLLTAYNSLSMPHLLNRIQVLTAENNCKVFFGVSLRNNDTEGLSQSSKDHNHLPSNLDLFYCHLKSIVAICHSYETDVRFSLFPWSKKNTSTTISNKASLKSALSTISISSKTLPKNSMSLRTCSCSDGVEDLWVIDERPHGQAAEASLPLFHTSEVVKSYPNLVTLIIRDSVSGLKCVGSDLSRWAIMDDYGMQLILGNLVKLKHLDLKGNLFFLTDSGVTGFSSGKCEEYRANQNLDNQNLVSQETPVPEDKMLTLTVTIAIPDTGDDTSDKLAESESSFGSWKIDSSIQSESLTKDATYSFRNLQALEYCNLEFVGPKFTSISLTCGFNGMKALKFLRVAGLMQIDVQSILQFKKDFFIQRPNCKVDIIKTKT